MSCKKDAKVRIENVRFWVGDGKEIIKLKQVSLWIVYLKGQV